MPRSRLEELQLENAALKKQLDEVTRQKDRLLDLVVELNEADRKKHGCQSLDSKPCRCGTTAPED